MNTATFEVDGMVVRDRFLWVGWPNNIGKALDELKDVSSHKFDYETWIFTVIFNPKEVNKEKIIEAVDTDEGQFEVKNWKIIQ